VLEGSGIVERQRPAECVVCSRQRREQPSITRCSANRAHRIGEAAVAAGAALERSAECLRVAQRVFGAGGVAGFGGRAPLREEAVHPQLARALRIVGGIGCVRWQRRAGRGPAERLLKSTDRANPLPRLARPARGRVDGEVRLPCVLRLIHQSEAVDRQGPVVERGWVARCAVHRLLRHLVRFQQVPRSLGALGPHDEGGREVSERRGGVAGELGEPPQARDGAVERLPARVGGDEVDQR